ncbi:DMT family protein [Rufibacter glacialis]|uniref:DMT family protein n=1 Tax=Rufibacter glacialis TaxID=1259555 RepID=A0A5M8QSJ9_9BACT|nr:DMT family protein [Rufibacter glacialis]KAA6437172.1 DMT family protein [Rufibacter glacialis]GGK61489.1 membrane protein [Rufibacter glacialis]
MKAFYTIFLLCLSNLFMTFAWYGHLYFKRFTLLQKLGLMSVILLSWGLAFFEYIFQVPANRIGYQQNGGPFSLFELKTLQEIISLSVFTLVTVYVFRTEKLAWNHLVGFALLVLAVFFVFKKW